MWRCLCCKLYGGSNYLAENNIWCACRLNSVLWMLMMNDEDEEIFFEFWEVGNGGMGKLWRLMASPIAITFSALREGVQLWACGEEDTFVSCCFVLFLFAVEVPYLDSFVLLFVYLWRVLAHLFLTKKISISTYPDWSHLLVDYYWFSGNQINIVIFILVSMICSLKPLPNLIGFLLLAAWSS